MCRIVRLQGKSIRTQLKSITKDLHLRDSNRSFLRPASSAPSARFFPLPQATGSDSVQSGPSPSALPLTPSPMTFSTLQNPRGVVDKGGSSQHSLVFQQLSKKKPVVEMVSLCVVLEGSMAVERGSGTKGNQRIHGRRTIRLANPTYLPVEGMISGRRWMVGLRGHGGMGSG